MKIRLQLLHFFVVAMSLATFGSGSQLSMISKSFEVGSGGTLVVDVVSGDVNLQTGRSTVLVDVLGIDQRDAADLDIHQEGNNVYVYFKPEDGHSDAKFEISIPASFTARISTTGGDIRVSGDLDGDLTAKTAGGDVDFESISGNVEVKTAGGDISSGIVGGTTKLTTAGGDIKLESSEGEVELRTSGGDIKVGDVGRQLKAVTAGGDIHLGNVGGEAQAKTAGGDIEVGEVAGSATLSTAGGDIHLQAASGMVEARTAGGDLELKNISGVIQGKTAGGDISAQLNPGGEGPSTLKTAGGDVDLYLPAGAAVRIRAVIKVRGNWAREIKDVELTSEFENPNVIHDEVNKEVVADFAINGGGPTIELQTVNGNIHIRKQGGLM